MGISRIPRRRLLVWLILAALMLALAAWTVICVREPAADSRPQPSITTEDSLATAVAFNEAWAAARPTATATPDGVAPLAIVSCTPPNREPIADTPHFLHWTPDGSQLIFDHSDTIWTVDSQGTRVEAVVDADPEDPDANYPSVYEFYADLGPDGSRIVYSTCEYPLDVSTSGHSGESSLYDIATVDLVGGGRQRLTESQGFDGYPVWSPDGKTIAFIRGGGPDGDTWIYLLGDSSVASRWWLGDPDVAAGRFPPAWSPNGESLALIGYESTPGGRQSCLYTGQAIGPELVQFRTTRSAVFRVTEATGPPSWSPDGQHIAFTRSGGEDAGIYVVRPNGSDPQLIVDGTSEGPLWPLDATGLWENVSMFRGSPVWSPDGRSLLFITREITPNPLEDPIGFVPSRVFTVGLEGGEVVELDFPLPAFLRVTAAAWSPDGSRLAVSGDIRQFPWGEYEARRVILTADPDGGNMRILAAGDTVLSLVSGHYDESVGGLFEWNSPDPGIPVDTAPCSEGLVVPNPEENPGLVQDCETLLTIRDTLAGRVDLGWSRQVSIGEWEGITIGGEPLRVRKLGLSVRGLTGALSPELGLLSGLVELGLSGNWLSGQIPPELGNHTELESLDLSSNFLSGNIPPELGSLGNLRTLDLHGNVLSGSIPSELGSLSSLEELYLSGNRLEDPIPPELGMLKRLFSLTLSRNRLSGIIPTEMFGLIRLTSLDLWDTNLTGCFAAEFPEIPEEQNVLEGC